jgi:long-chain acyl-CoA synthetase
MSKRPFTWEKSYTDDLKWDLDVPKSTIVSLFAEATDEFKDRPAIDFRGKDLSYTDLRQRAQRAAGAFLSIGIGKTRPLALYLPNVPYHPIAFFGGFMTGAPLVHLSPLDAERELAHKIQDSGARTVFTTDFINMLPLALKLLDRGLVDHVIVGEDEEWGKGDIPLAPIPERAGVIRFKALLEKAQAPASLPAVSPDDTALLQYTGGTTGLPKGAVLTHGNLIAAVTGYKACADALGLNHPGEEIIICVLPLFHIYALTTILLCSIQDGNKILLRTRFDPQQIVSDIETLRATAFPGVPTMWIALLNLPGIEKRDLSSLRYCGSGGAPLPVEVQSQFAKLTGLDLKGGWGMTETSPAGTFIPTSGDVPLGTIGLPMPGIEMGIVSLADPLRELAPGETGEIRIRGPNVTQGYWKQQEETAKSMAGGYFLTGDIGYMDEKGYFYIVDRKKDMIISGGFNVYPNVIEQAIYEHPSVEECAVIGVKDPYRGEAAKAFVKLKAGAPSFSLEELNAFLADKIGRHEMPALIEFRTSLPRTAVGKILKTELRKEEQQKAPDTARAAGEAKAPPRREAGFKQFFARLLRS